MFSLVTHNNFSLLQTINSYKVSRQAWEGQSLPYARLEVYMRMEL